MAGFYPVDHGDLEHPVFAIGRRQYTRWEAYCWLLDHAAYDSQDKPVKLDRGQVAMSVGALAKAWKWPKSSVQRFLDGLSREGFIVYSPAAVAGTTPRTGERTASLVITLCKYAGVYQWNGNGGTGERTGERTGAATAPYYIGVQESNKGTRKQARERPTASPPPSTPPHQGDLLPSAEVVALALPDERSAFDAYNEAARQLDLRPCRSFEPIRIKLRARLREWGGLEGWAKVLDMVSESQFIRDWRTDGWSSFSLHSLLQPNTLAKLMDGAYNGKRQKSTKQEPAAMGEMRDHYREHHQDSFYHDIGYTGTVKTK